MNASMIPLVGLAVLACATPASGQALRHSAGGFELEVLVDGAPAPTYHHRGETYLLGQQGARYVLRVHNRTGRRVEAVVSVDGRDVIDGRPGDYRNKRGYLVPAWGSVDIDGWRLSARQAAAFRFSSVADSYAARMGNAREVGVIGVAVFPERVYYPPRRPYPVVPYDRGDDRPHSKAPESAPASPPSAAESGPAKDAERSGRGRPGLGTEFGEETYSPIREVQFVRANATRPAVVLGSRYNDRAGLVALGIDVDGTYYSPDDTYLRGTARPFPVSTGPYSAPPPGWRRW